MEEQQQQLQEQVEQDQPQEQQVEITEELVKDFDELLKNSRQDVRKQTLVYLLSYVTTEENRLKFKDTEVIKYMLRYTKEDGLETSALSNLINFSAEEIFQKQIIDLQGVDRIIEHMKEVYDIVKEGNEESKTEEDVILNEKQKLFFQLTQLLLLNLTQNIEGREMFINLKDEAKQGRNVLYFLKMFQWNSEIFQFIPNMLVNVSNEESCRKVLIEDKYLILENIISFILNRRRQIRLGALKILRNCLFEFEVQCFQERIFSEKVEFFTYLCKCVAMILLNSSLLVVSEQHKNYLQKNFPILPEYTSEAKNEQQEIEEINIVLDLFMVLVNIDLKEKKINYNSEQIQSIVTILKALQLQEEIRDKLEVISNVY